MTPSRGCWPRAPRTSASCPRARWPTELGNPRVANVILLGALSRFVEIPAEAWLNAIAGASRRSSGS